MKFRTGLLPIITAVAFGATLPLVSMVGVQPAAAAGAVAPYCIAVGSGGEGGGYRTTRCEFFDLQQCQQAAVGGGNCVQNIDYHGEPPAAPPGRRSHRAR